MAPSHQAVRRFLHPYRRLTFAYIPPSLLGVTHATLQNWQYMEVIRTAADAKCSSNLVNSIERIDAILAHSPNFIKRQLKGLFGLENLQNDDDFASMIEVR